MPGLNDNGYFIVSKTTIYKNAVDAAAPDASILTNSTALTSASWVVVGHIGDESASGNVSFTRDGGDTTTKGSITKRAIRQLVDPVASGVDVDISQLTRDPFALYIGTSGGTNPTTLQVEGEKDGQATSGAMLVVWQDGTNAIGLYAPNGAWTGRDNISTDSVSDAVVLPLHVGFLDSPTLTGPNSKPLRYTWIAPTLLAIS